VIERTGFEFGFGKRIEPLEVSYYKPYDCYTFGMCNFSYKESFLRKRKEIRLMFYDYDGKVLNQKEWDLIVSKFSNDCLVFDSGKGLHFISLCEDIEGNSEKKALELSYRLNEDYYACKQRTYLTLRTMEKRYLKHRKPKDVSEIYREKPKFIRMVKEPRFNTKLSYQHLIMYAGLELPKYLVKMYLTRCKVKKYKTNLIRYRCKT
jgi:hypothetical protein